MKWNKLASAGDGRRASLMAMLNVAFRHGSRVCRAVGARGNGFQEFNVYAPRVLAGIRKLSPTLADRSFRIELQRKSEDQPVQRLNFRLQAKSLARLRDDLHIAALSNAREVADSYDRAQDLALPAFADDRLRDILEPLFAIASTADSQVGRDLHTQPLINAGQALARMRAQDDTAEDQWALALAALQSLCGSNRPGLVMSAHGALNLFQHTAGLGSIDTLQRTRRLLRCLGLRSAVHRRERFWRHDRPTAATARGYEITPMIDGRRSTFRSS